jgi:tetratricopeptide (TPR) repeat protein
MPAFFFSFGLLAFMATTSAFAANAELIFRSDSGLTKTEYLLAVGKFTAAVETANEVLTRHPNSADAYTYRGYAYNRLGQAADALKDFQKALLIDPSHLGANKYLADIYLQKGDISRAMEQMQVLRLTCGQLDCAELNELQREIDQYKSAKEDKKESKKE